jgi:hypothetical protein
MMKKTYISPELLLVELRCSQMLAESVPVDVNGATTTIGTSGGWVKEENTTVSDVNVWDEEW